MKSHEITNAFTVDVEDYFQVTAFESDIPRQAWDRQESRVVANTRRILDLLRRHNVAGTFFVLGWVAERFPELVAEIHQAGHELASHSFWHRLIYTLEPEEFREDLVRSREAIHHASGVSVRSYRAPTFSITKRSLWALDILASEGFDQDSSIYPVHHDRYGIPEAPRCVFQVPTSHGRLVEFPPALVRLGPLKIPISGGGYFRLYPFSWTVWGLRAINQRHGRPFVFYIHPWEIDPGQPRLAAGTRVSRCRHYMNLAGTFDRLDRLLGTFRFGRMCDVLDELAAKPEEMLTYNPETSLGVEHDRVRTGPA